MTRLKRFLRWSGLSAKDVVTITLSALALSVSVLALFYNVIRQVDRLTVEMPSPAIAVRHSEDGLYVPIGDNEIVFINSGTRPVAVLSVSVRFVQNMSSSTACAERKGPVFGTNFEPTVLKERDIVIRKIRISHVVTAKPEVKKSMDPFEMYQFDIDEPNRKLERFTVDVCLQVQVSTISTSGYGNASVWRYLIKKDGVEIITGDYRAGPRILVNERGTIFGQ
jgi:hypothetical protein